MLMMLHPGLMRVPSFLFNTFILCFSHLLECIFVILSSPATCTHASTFVMVRELMSQMLHQQSSLLYLSSQPDTTNGIVRVLAQNGVSYSLKMCQVVLLFLRLLEKYVMTLHPLFDVRNF